MTTWPAPLSLAAWQIAPGQIEVARRLSGDFHHLSELEAENGRHRALADRDRLLHRLAAQAKQTRSVLERERSRGAKSRIFAERMPGDVSRLRRGLEARFGFQNPQGRHARGHERRLGVGGQREFGLGSFEHQLREVLGQGGVDALEYVARGGKLVRKRLPHADRLGPLTRKHQRRLHDRLLRLNAKRRLVARAPAQRRCTDTARAGLSSAVYVRGGPDQAG